MNNFQAIKWANKEAFTVADKYGSPIRVHDGYAYFVDKKTADWAAELCNGAFSQGQCEKAKEIKECLYIEDKSDD